MYNKTLGTTKKLAFALIAAAMLATTGTGVKAFAAPLETTEEAEEEQDETVSTTAEAVVAEETSTTVITEETAVAFAEAYGDAEFTTAVFEDAAAPQGYTDDTATTEEVAAEETEETEETETTEETEEAETAEETEETAETETTEETVETETTEETEGEREIQAYYDFGADEYAKRMEPLVTTDEDGRTIYINYLPTEDDKIVGWHQDGFKIMAVVDASGTKGVIYIESNNLPDKIKIDSIGLTELKNIIKFEDGSYVKSIEFGSPKSFGLLFAKYAITVNSSGVNKWFYTQSMTFQDESGDAYKLGMMRYGEHEVAYNSDAPKISVITWGY